MANTEPVHIRCRKCGTTWPEITTPPKEMARLGVEISNHLMTRHGKLAALAPKILLHRVQLTEA